MKKYFRIVLMISFSAMLVALVVGAAINAYFALHFRRLRQTLDCGNGRVAEIWEDPIDPRCRSLFVRLLDTNGAVILDRCNFDYEIDTPREYLVLSGTNSDVIGIADRRDKPWHVRALVDLASRESWTYYERTRSDWARAEELIYRLAQDYPTNPLYYYNDRPSPVRVTYVPAPSTNTSPVLHTSPQDL